VTRGAYFGDRSTRNSGIVEEALGVRDIPCHSMTFDEEDIGRKWVMQGHFILSWVVHRLTFYSSAGWSNTFSLTTQIHCMQYVKHVPLLRHTLKPQRESVDARKSSREARILPQWPIFDRNALKAVPGAYIQAKAEGGAGR